MGLGCRVISRESLAAALLLKNLFPPRHEDWMVQIWYQDHLGKDNEMTIRAGREGEPITEKQAVDIALNAMRKSVITRRSADWVLPPRIYDVAAKPQYKLTNKSEEAVFDELTARLKALKPHG